MLYGVLSLLALGQALNTPALQSMISRSTAAAEQGSVLGVSQGFSSLARVIGPATGGYLFGRNPAYPFWFGAVLMVLAFLLAGRVARSVQG
jgi:MFS family permease